MSVRTDLLNEISATYNILGTTAPSPAEQADSSQALALLFSELAQADAASTGWGAPTGVATRTTFDTTTVTLAQLAERVKALIDDATTRGELAP